MARDKSLTVRLPKSCAQFLTYLLLCAIEKVALAAMSTFGHFLRVTTYGESHCESVGCIVDNFPPGVPILEDLL